MQINYADTKSKNEGGLAYNYPSTGADYTCLQWEIIDKIIQSRDSAMNQVAVKNLELYECLGKVRQEYTKLKESDAKLKNRVIRLEQELQQNQPRAHSPKGKNCKQTSAAAAFNSTETEESKEPIAQKQKKSKRKSKRKKPKINVNKEGESGDEDMQFLDAVSH